MSGVLNFSEKLASIKAARGTQEVGHQSWNSRNLYVKSYHNDILYYTTRWDALCPYIEVTEEMLERAPKPFIAYAMPPDSVYGVPINDHYGFVGVTSEGFWTEERRMRKFRELDKQYKDFTYTETLVAGASLTVSDIMEMGRKHFSDYFIHDREIGGFIDYVRDLEVLILRMTAPNGELVLTDVSVVLPEYNQVYGSFCQWNRDYKNKSPGIYACLLASRWTAEHGYKHYNLGPVGDYGYKSLFVTEQEPIYAVGLVDPEHPLALDLTSPIHTDFKPEDINCIYRSDALDYAMRKVSADNQPGFAGAENFELRQSV